MYNTIPHKQRGLLYYKFLPVDMIWQTTWHHIPAYRNLKALLDTLKCLITVFTDKYYEYIYIHKPCAMFKKMTSSGRTENVRSRLCVSLRPACSCMRMRLRSLLDASLALSSANRWSPRLLARQDSSISSVILRSDFRIFCSGLK